MKILTDKYFNINKKISNFDEKIASFLTSSKELKFEYLTQSWSVFSSNIEGNTLDLNSFMNHKMNKNISKDVEEIENLISAYTFAQWEKLTEKNFLQTHKLSSKTLLIKSRRGIYRNDKVWVFGNGGLVYLAIEPEFVEKEMSKLFSDIWELLEKDLSSEEVFYYASLIHLVFVHIHPFPDWNGRTARLLEKWFLAEKLWEDFWKLPSEQNYWKNREQYYNNLNLWVNYYELDYSKSWKFLNMLKDCILKYNYF